MLHSKSACFLSEITCSFWKLDTQTPPKSMLSWSLLFILHSFIQNCISVCHLMRLRYVMFLMWIDWCRNSSEGGKIRFWNEPSDWVPWKQIAKWGAYPNSAISHPQCFFYCWIWCGLFRQQSLITWYWTVNVVLIATSLRISKQNPRQVAYISSIEMLNNNSLTWRACFNFFFFLENCWFHQQEGMDRPLIYVRPLAPFQKNWLLGFEVFVPASSLTSLLIFIYFNHFSIQVLHHLFCFFFFLGFFFVFFGAAVSSFSQWYNDRRFKASSKVKCALEENRRLQHEMSLVTSMLYIH